MPQVPIIMPQLGESIAEATIVDIKVKPGDEVADDQEIVDVETSKAVMGVTTPCKGKIAQITVQLKETYPVGAVLGYVEAREADAARFARQAPSPPQREVAEEIPARADQEVAPAREKKVTARDGDGARAGGLPVPVTPKGATFMSPRVRARMAELQLTTAELAGTPGAAAKLIGNRVVQSTSIDVGIAVEAEDGIMVPVIRSAEKTSLADLATKYKELIELARQRRISPDMQAGGIATVSNFGTFGMEWGTPIPLPDQTLLLGLGAGKKVPSWNEQKKEFIPRTEAQITLSFDHRSIDGGGAGRLLKRVIELLESPKKL